MFYFQKYCLGKNRQKLPPPISENSHSIIQIGDNVYIGTGTTILGPATIGSNVVIAAGSVVVKDIPNNCLVAGVPAKIIKTIEKEQIETYIPAQKR